MAGVINETAGTVQKLIHSCHEAQQGFHLAADAAEDATLKRLFNIYAQQRTRFAEELKDYLPPAATEDENLSSADWILDTPDTDNGLLEHCLEADAQSLELYREAMRHPISRKAHFLISAQFSLMERVHERMQNLLESRVSGTNRVQISTERAML